LGIADGWTAATMECISLTPLVGYYQRMNDLEARRRGSTVYLPTGMISMFPSALATGPMSLVQGKFVVP